VSPYIKGNRKKKKTLKPVVVRAGVSGKVRFHSWRLETRGKELFHKRGGEDILGEAGGRHEYNLQRT